MHRNGNPLQWTVKSAAFVLFFIGVGVYILYRVWPTPQYHIHPHHLMSWKNKEFISIPTSVLQDAKTLKPELKYANYQYETGQNISLSYQIIEPLKKENRQPIDLLFLHGNAFNSLDWVELNTLQIMAAAGYRCFAIDLIGGKKSASTSSKKLKSAGDKIRFLTDVIKRLNIKRPLIISPSMSGSYSIPFIMEPSPTTCKDRISGFLPIAPVETDSYSPSNYHRCRAPNMIVYGSKDTDLGLEATGNLRNMPNTEIYPMLGAKHACYIDNPGLFHKLLYNYAEAVVIEERMSD